jgi:hypothetical protein
LTALSDLVRVCPPRPDKCFGDRRSTSSFDTSPYQDICHQSGPTAWVGHEGEENQGEAEDNWHDTDYDPNLTDLEGEGTGELDQSGVDTSLGETQWEDVYTELRQDLHELEQEERLSVLYRKLLGPSSYYWAGGWFSTGMENVSGCLPSDYLLTLSRAEVSYEPVVAIPRGSAIKIPPGSPSATKSKVRVGPLNISFDLNFALVLISRAQGSARPHEAARRACATRCQQRVGQCFPLHGGGIQSYHKDSSRLSRVPQRP